MVIKDNKSEQEVRESAKIIYLSLAIPFIVSFISVLLKRIGIQNNQSELRYLMIFICWCFAGKYFLKNIEKKENKIFEPKIYSIADIFLVMVWFYLMSILFLLFWHLFKSGFLSGAADNEKSMGSVSPLFTCMIVPILEEIQYRKICMGYLIHKNGRLYALAAVTIIFTLAHGIPGAFVVFLPSLAMGVLYTLTGKLKWSIAFHIIYNTVLLYSNGFGLIGKPFSILLILTIVNIIVILVLFKVIITRKIYQENLFEFRAKNGLKVYKGKIRKFLCSPAMILYYLIPFYLYFITITSNYL